MRRIILSVMLFVAPSYANPSLLRTANPVPDEYIVVLKDNTPADSVTGLATSIASSYGGTVLTVWKDALKGFVFQGPDASAVNLASDPRVAFVEENGVSYPLSVSTVITDPDTGVYNWLWHLDRLDEKTAPGDNTYNLYNTGAGVYAYVIDNGVWTAHPSLNGRVVATLDFSEDKEGTGVWSNDRTGACSTSPYCYTDGAGIQHCDFGWHGTSVASLIAGSEGDHRAVGAARTKVVSLKVARCRDMGIETADVLHAVNFVQSGVYNPWRYQPGVMNFSGYVVKGDPGYSSVVTAIESTVTNTGFPFFTSADNWGGDACQFSPNYNAYTNVNKTGRYVFTVGGTLNPVTNGYDDYRWATYDSLGRAVIGPGKGSNTGECVSVFAPAERVYAARGAAYPTRYDRATGTSFASPIVAGVAASYIEYHQGRYGQRPTYTQIYDYLLANATEPVLDRGTRAAWMCVKYGLNTTYFGPYYNEPASCSPGYTKINLTPGTTSAKMIYWNDQGLY